jgi:hypothetical protein
MKKLTYLTLCASLLATTALACPAENTTGKAYNTTNNDVCLKTKTGKHQHAQAAAGSHAMHGMHHTPASTSGNPAVAAYESGMALMHKDMAITYTGDADYDFVAGMIPHHQGAVDMAQVVMQYGTDPQVRRLAAEIIRGQNLEIKWMKQYMQQLKARGLKPLEADAKPKAKFHETKWIGGKNHFWQ